MIIAFRVLQQQKEHDKMIEKQKNKIIDNKITSFKIPTSFKETKVSNVNYNYYNNYESMLLF